MPGESPNCEGLPSLDDLRLPDLVAELVTRLLRVPGGRVVSFGTLAESLGHVRAARWVADVLADPPEAVRHVCHRVVRRTGELGGYFAGDGLTKQRLLEAEGIAIVDGRIDLERFEHRPIDVPGPLVRLEAWQRIVAGRVDLVPWRYRPRRVGAVDVAYPRSGAARGAYVLVDTATGELLWSTTVKVDVAFPYISGFLAYRELPVHAELLRAARGAGKLAAVVFVDGNGLLHPRRAGVACQLGVMSGVRTVGIGKRLLCGSVDLDGVTPEVPREVVHEGRVIGTVVRARAGANPFFVSPGHRIDVRSATRLARDLVFGHRLPEPIFLADRASRHA